MKREYFIMLFLLFFTVMVVSAIYLFEDANVIEILGKFSIIWIIIAVYAGQYSMKFPKVF